MNVDYNKVENLAKEVISKKSGFSFDLRKSNKSESLYLFVHYDNLIKSVRISNHRNGYDYYFDKEIVSDKINIKCLRRTIEKLCVLLQKKKLNICFNAIALKQA